MNEREVLLKLKRPERTPLGARNFLTVDGLKDTKDYVYRWVNDKNDKPQACYRAGWEFVDKNGKVVGDVNVETGKGVGSGLTKGVGGGVKAYLMKIPRDVWEHDRKIRVDNPTNELEESMMPDSRKRGLDRGTLTVSSRRTTQSEATGEE